MRLGRLFGLPVSALVALTPGTASASTVSVVPTGESYEFRYKADPGERNRLEASAAAGILTLVDSGARVTAGAACERISKHRAICNAEDLDRRGGANPLMARLGGGADMARLNGGLVWSALDGGPGSDDLAGGSDSDTIAGGHGADLLDGGGGIDNVSYAGRPAPVHVRLGGGSSGNGGTLDGAGDRLRRFEIATGGDGDDHLIGTRGRDELRGGPGADTLDGGGGPDQLAGEEGDDELHGQNGPDDLRGGEGGDRAFGGPGRDELITPAGDGADLLVGGGDPEDSVFYSDLQVRVELNGLPDDGACDDATCSASGEGDDVRGVAEVNSSFGDDVLIGSDLAETFGPGAGSNMVMAKGGDDFVILSLTYPDTVDCGAGIDTVSGAEPGDTLIACEL